MGSAKSRSLFKTALAGAALGTIGGLAAFQSGNIIISSPSTPFHHHNKNYYWGQEYYQQKPDEISCSITLNDLIHPTGETTAPASGASDGTHVFSPNQLLSQLQFENGTRPKEIIWSCKQETEICCGTDCCAAPVQNNNNPNNGTFFA
uniref:CX domain-containing protein n=1 Tax=Panagrolaimus davidi TaxID=227884 RepID=A0A914QRW9_9BILA